MLSPQARERRTRIIELVVAGSVVFISLASLFTAVHQSLVAQRTLAASVWPSVELDTGNYDEERRAHSISFTIANRGVGPARIERLYTRWEDVEAGSVAEIIVSCCAEGDDEAARRRWIEGLVNSQEIVFLTSVVHGRTLAPDQEINFFTFDRPGPDAPGDEIWTALDRARFEFDMRVCYCSVFDECWETALADPRPEQVRDCRAPARD